MAPLGTWRKLALNTAPGAACWGAARQPPGESLSARPHSCSGPHWWMEFLLHRDTCPCWSDVRPELAAAHGDCLDVWEVTSRSAGLGDNSWVAGWGCPEGKGMVQCMAWLLTVPYTFLLVLRDISERGRDLEQILSQYITFVKPAFEEFCLPVSMGNDTHKCQKCLFPWPAHQTGAFCIPGLSPSGAGENEGADAGWVRVR